MTDIFERIKLLQPRVAKSQNELAQLLGADKKNFTGAMNRKSSTVYPLLPKFFELSPDLSAEWLYLGRGDQIKNEASGDCSALRQQIQELTEANRRLAETNQRLVEELLRRE